MILRVANSGVIDEKRSSSSFFKMDKKKKQVTLLAPDSHREHAETQEEAGEQKHRGLDVSAPKMFAFDGLYTDEDGQNDLSGSALSDVLHAVRSIFFTTRHRKIAMIFTRLAIMRPNIMEHGARSSQHDIIF